MKYMFTVILLMMTSIAFAAEVDDTVIAGAGTQTCTDWQEARNEHDESVDLFLASWIQGFLSGLNVQREADGKEMVAIPESQALLSSMDAFCNTHASAAVFAGSLAIYTKLDK